MTIRAMPAVTLAGTGTDIVEVAEKFSYTQLTVVGLETGTFSVESRIKGSNRFSLVENGQIELGVTDTIIVKKAFLDAVRLTVSDQSQYDLIVVQHTFAG